MLLNVLYVIELRVHYYIKTYRSNTDNDNDDENDDDDDYDVDDRLH